MIRPKLRRAMPAEAVPFTVNDRVLQWLARQGPDESHMYIGMLARVQGPAPAVDDLRKLLAGRAEFAPVLAYRPDRRRRHWAPDPGFDAAAHVHQRVLPQGADPIAEANEHMRRPLPDRRPLWDLTLLHGHTPAEYLLLYRVHHVFQDGMAMNATLEALFGQRRLGTPCDSPYQRTRRSPASHPPGGPRWDLGVPLRSAPAWTPNLAPLTGRRTLKPVPLDAELAQATAETTGASLNQVCLAALTAALRTWSLPDWNRPPTGAATPVRPGTGLPVGIPVNLRQADRAGALGNHIALLSIALPCGEPDPIRQLQAVVGQTSARRILRHRDRGRSLGHHIPFPLARAMFAWCTHPRQVAAAVTTVRVAPRLTVQGAPITELIGYPPLAARQRLVVAMTQYGNAVTGSILADTGVPDPSSLGTAWQQALADLHTATTSPDSATLRPRDT